MEADPGWWHVGWAELIGIVAGVLTTFSSLPQVIKVWRTRSTGDLSLIMLVMAVTGIALWLVYGLARSDWPVVGANACTFTLNALILGLKLRYG